MVVRARLHDRHLIDGEPLSFDGEDWGRVGCWDRERLNRRSGHHSLAIRAPRVLAKGPRTQQNSTTREERRCPISRVGSTGPPIITTSRWWTATGCWAPSGAYPNGRRVRRTDRHPGRCRRRCSGPDANRDRDPTRLAGRRAAAQQSTHLPDQPEVGGPLPAAHVVVG
jgi:hypothetical protein